MKASLVPAMSHVFSLISPMFDDNKPGFELVCSTMCL